MHKLFTKVAFGILGVVLLSILIDLTIETINEKEAKNQLNKDIMTASFYSLSSQNEYFGSGGTVSLPDGTYLHITDPYSTDEYKYYVSSLANSGDEYLELSSMVLGNIDFSTSPYNVNSINTSYNPAQLNLAYMNESFIQYLFENSLKRIIVDKGNEGNNHIVIDDVKVNVNFNLERLSPEIIRSIYGNDDTIADLFSSLSIIRFREISEVLSKSRLVPKYTVEFKVDYSYCTTGYYNSRASITSNWFHRTSGTFVTNDDVDDYLVKPNQIKYDSETVTITREYAVVS